MGNWRPGLCYHVIATFVANVDVITVSRNISRPFLVVRLLDVRIGLRDKVVSEFHVRRSLAPQPCAGDRKVGNEA